MYLYNKYNLFFTIPSYYIYIIFNINTLNIDILFMFCYMFIVDSRDTQILCIHTHIDHIDHIVIKYNYRLLDMSK